MANREENLKKINAELEQLSDEELENVAGGTWNDTADDAKFFHALNGSTPFLRGIEVAFSRTGSLLNKLTQEWAKVGVKFEPHNGAIYENKYFIDNQEVTQGVARRHAMEVTGIILDGPDWQENH